jgi:hypothetical protein
MGVTLSGPPSTVVVALVGYCFLPGVQQSLRVANESPALRSFLRNYLRDSYAAGRTATRYFAASVHLTDDRGGQVIVYFTDRHSCGTGGCTTLILAPQGSSYRVVTSITIGWPPIRVLRTTSHGWHDLAMWVEGGGIQPGYEAELSFNGKTYPSNPSVPPARRLGVMVPGTVAVPKDAEGVSLY